MRRRTESGEGVILAGWAQGSQEEETSLPRARGRGLDGGESGLAHQRIAGTYSATP